MTKFSFKYLILTFLTSGAGKIYARGAAIGGSTVKPGYPEIAAMEEQITSAYIYTGSIIAILITSLVYLIYSNRKQKKKANQLVRKERELAEAQRARADKAEQMQQQLLANMSHEMRTPMNTVIGMTELTLDTQLTEKQKQYLTAVKKSSENLLVIITDVLDRNKKETAKAEYDASQFSLRQQIKQVCDTLKDLADTKGLTLQTEIAPDIPDALSGDPLRLTQVLINLCTNAIQNTDKGVIKIIIDKAAGTEATLCFKVADPGMSIPRDKVGNMLERFHSTAPGTWQKYKGADIGISIAKTLVELEGGELQTHEEAGIGSEFIFTITYEAAVKKAASALPGIRILVAEDDEYNQVVITDTLETIIEDALVDIAKNGNEAIEKHATGDYDIILMDVQMPETDGLQATRIIRKSMEARKKNIPIIALTAGVLTTELDECFAAGMDDYIPKPFTRTQLLNTLGKYYRNEPPALPPGEPQHSKVTDLAFLSDFCKDDRLSMQKYIDIYLKVTPANLDKIDAAVAAKDYRALARTVHAMKAHLNYMGMKQTRKLAEAAETCAKEQTSLAELPQLIYKLREECERSMEELRSFS